MIDLGPHAVFIIWAYVGVIIACAGLIAYVVSDRRGVEKRIAALEAQGVRRRSSQN
jgi:heme exporter protein D